MHKTFLVSGYEPRNHQTGSAVKMSRTGNPFGDGTASQLIVAVLARNFVCTDVKLRALA